jgi:hypothetical protein
MFEVNELELIKQWLNHNLSKNNEIKMMLDWEIDEEVEEIDEVINSIFNKINNNDLKFNERELFEIKTWLMWIHSKDINNTKIWELTTKVRGLLMDS